MSDVNEFLLENQIVTVEEDTKTEKPKRRGRPPGSKSKKTSEEKVPVSIDISLVAGFVNVAFSTVVNIAGENWKPTEDEKRSIAESLRIVIEKRLPDSAIENLPEFALGISVLSYVGRCYFVSAINSKP